MIKDTLQRPLRDLRISVTDRCNFRCHYCMPSDRSYKFMPRKELLTFEEITQLVRLFAALGVRKLRITGGEPLLRKDLAQLLGMLSEIEGIEDIALTTNGYFLARYAKALVRAGLHRVTVSLDSLVEKTFAALNGRAVSPALVCEGIDAAAAAGLPVKINCVVQQGINDHEIVDIAGFFREKGHILRFIEFMDVGNVNGWNMEHVVPAKEIHALIAGAFPCEPSQANFPGEVARRYRYLDGKGEFGLITSVSQPFCGSCNRVRISADGELFTCLFSSHGHDLKTTLRKKGVQAVAAMIRQVWGQRKDRYSDLRGRELPPQEKVEMFKIGG